MLNKLKEIKAQKSEEGFTIIEVMIVLAIAGLIILIVLIAIPALQRNGRNTAIKNDASAIAAAVGECASNNDGRAPTNVNGTGTVTVTCGGTTTAKVQPNTAVSAAAVAGGVPTAANPALNTIRVILGVKCENAAGTYTAGTAGQVNSRAVAIYYSVETGGGQQQRCITS